MGTLFGWQVNSLVPRGGNSLRIVWSRDGKRLGILGSEPVTRLLIMDRTSDGLRGVASIVHQYLVDFDFSPDGSQVVLARRSKRAKCGSSPAERSSESTI